MLQIFSVCRSFSVDLQTTTYMRKSNQLLWLWKNYSNTTIFVYDRHIYKSCWKDSFYLWVVRQSSLQDRGKGFWFMTTGDLNYCHVCISICLIAVLHYQLQTHLHKLLHILWTEIIACNFTHTVTDTKDMSHCWFEQAPRTTHIHLLYAKYKCKHKMLLLCEHGGKALLILNLGTGSKKRERSLPLLGIK